MTRRTACPRWSLSAIVIAFSTCAMVSAATQTLAEEPPSVNVVQRFVTTHCADCHSGDDAERDFDVTALPALREPSEPTDSADVLTADQVAAWSAVFRKVKNGEMPPADYDQPTDAERATLLKQLEHQLRNADRRRQIQNGRSVIRRLNRVEFENSLSDLLGIPLHIRELLPADASGHGFDTVGEALNISAVQMEAYLEAIDVALDQATHLIDEPPRRKFRLSYLETAGMMMEYRRGGPFLPLQDGVAMFAPDFFSHFNSLLDTFVVAHSARYRVRVSAYALRSEDPVTLTVRMGGPGHKESDEVRKKVLGHVSVTEGEPQIFEFEDDLERGQMFRIYPSSLRKMRFAGKQWELRQDEYEGPAVVVQWVEVDGPIYDSWPPAAHRQLYADTPTETLPEAKPNGDPNAHLLGPPKQTAKPRLTLLKKANQETGNRRVYDPKQKIGGEKIYRRTRISEPLKNTRRLAPAAPKDSARQLLSDFARRAFREPADSAIVETVVSLVHRWLDEGADFEQAMRLGFKTILVSPGFLYHQGNRGVAESGNSASAALQLNDFELAERLSYFLWSSAPDTELRELAANSELHRPDVLRAQVDRLLKDERCERFYANFLGQWLDLREIEFTSPDSTLFPEFDDLLQWSMVEESKAFFRELIQYDLSVANVIDSDFVMLNDRLAKLYDIPGVSGVQFRRVPLTQNSVRGGMLTQASVLKVTANGTTTSPVVRGVWVLERIMGTPPDPPPPGVPAIEPDIRGATTVREQLDLHRSVKSCASCHQKIDPPGVALESFDVIGGFRERYRALAAGDSDRKDSYTPAGPRPIRYKHALPVDPADQLKDGRTFADIREFKSLLADDKNKVTATVAEKFIVYATGAPLTFADYDELDRIVDQSQKSNHGVRSLIHLVVQSRLFQER